jgi:hypothetical protein
MWWEDPVQFVAVVLVLITLGSIIVAVARKIRL